MTYGAGLHLIEDDLGGEDELDWLDQAEDVGEIEKKALAFLAPHAAFADFLLRRAGADE